MCVLFFPYHGNETAYLLNRLFSTQQSISGDCVLDESRTGPLSVAITKREKEGLASTVKESRPAGYFLFEKKIPVIISFCFLLFLRLAC